MALIVSSGNCFLSANRNEIESGFSRVDFTCRIIILKWARSKNGVVRIEESEAGACRYKGRAAARL